MLLRVAYQQGEAVPPHSTLSHLELKTPLRKEKKSIFKQTKLSKVQKSQVVTNSIMHRVQSWLPEAAPWGPWLMSALRAGLGPAASLLAAVIFLYNAAGAMLTSQALWEKNGGSYQLFHNANHFFMLGAFWGENGIHQFVKKMEVQVSDKSTA